jgi:GNAT superfamily N-acetyltransferase
VAEVPVAVAIDDDACEAFAALDPRFAVDLPDDHPFVLAEIERWRAATARGHALFACTEDGDPVGLVVLDRVAGRPHLEQVSVRRAWMARGIGRMLVEWAIRWSAPEGELWLTTYDRVPWNRPWYERLGFTVVSDEDAGPEVREILRAERDALPTVHARVAMVFRQPQS